MTHVDLHLLLRPLALPEVPQYRTDRASLESAAGLYEQAIAKGYDEATAERLSRVARLTGWDHKYDHPGQAGLGSARQGLSRRGLAGQGARTWPE